MPFANKRRVGFEIYHMTLQLIDYENKQFHRITFSLGKSNINPINSDRFETIQVES